MEQAGGLSLRDAAVLAGVSPTTLKRHIDSGKLSAPKPDGKHYAIDQSEIGRVYGVVPVERSENELSEQSGTANDNMMLQANVELLRQQLADKDILIAEKDARITDLRNAMNLLSDHRPRRRRWWWFGRSAN